MNPAAKPPKNMPARCVKFTKPLNGHSSPSKAKNKSAMPTLVVGMSDMPRLNMPTASVGMAPAHAIVYRESIMSLANLTTPQMIFLGLLVITTFFLLMRTSRYFTRPKSPEPNWSSIARKPKDSDGRGANVPQEMAGWEVETHEFVREIKAELDSKMRTLQAFTADADRAAARLEAALQGIPNPALFREGEAPAEPTKMPSSSSSSAARREPRSPDIAKPFLKFSEEAGRGRQGIDLSNLPTSQAESLRPAGIPRAERTSAQAKKEEIHTLADYGMTPAEIASRVSQPIGEVELILSLRGKK
jgi:hypothetical protein